MKVRELMDNDLRKRGFYSDFGHEYLQMKRANRLFLYRQNARLCAILRNIRKNFHEDEAIHILDIGPGDGTILHEIYLRYPNAHCTGIEKSKVLIQNCPYHDIEMQYGDAENLNLDSNKFDIAICSSVIAHLSGNHISFVNSVYNSLKLGGIFILISPNPFLTKIATLIKYLKYTGKTDPPSKHMLFNLLKNAGFHIQKFEGFLLSPFPIPYEIDQLEKVLRYFDIHRIFSNYCLVGKKM